MPPTPDPTLDPTLAAPAGDDGRGRGLPLALGVAIVLLALSLPTAGPVALGPTAALLAAVAATLLLSVRRNVAPLAAGVLVVGGVAVRAASASPGSDVLLVTVAAIHRVLDGLGPYGTGYAASTPPGAPFPYGPVALVWYLPALDDPRAMELIAAGAVMAALALGRRWLGLAVYATLPLLVRLTMDGSNDTSAGLLILAALAVAERRPAAGAAVLAVAVAFKPYALAWAPGLLASGGLPAVGAFAVASAVAWSPLLAWGPGAYLASLRLSESVHGPAYGSLAELLRALGVDLDRAVFGPIQVAAGGLSALVALLRARSHDAVVVAGTVTFLATLFLGWWSTWAYVSAVAPILAWKLDRWVWDRPVSSRA